MSLQDTRGLLLWLRCEHVRMVLTFRLAAKIVLLICKLQLAAIWRRAWDLHYRKQLELICNLAVAEEQEASEQQRQWLQQIAVFYWRRQGRLNRERPRWVDFPLRDYRPHVRARYSWPMGGRQRAQRRLE